jgi:energy-coupling factor transporter transmembrane protein EcfT
MRGSAGPNEIQPSVKTKMWDWQRVLSLMIAIVIVVIRFESFQRVSDYWGTLLSSMFPVGLALLGIWYGDELDDRQTSVPSWLVKAVGWLVLIIYLSVFILLWRIRS